MKVSTADRLLLAWLCPAVLVTLLRFLNAAELGFDLTIQIQAAQNLLAGKGLSLYPLYRHFELDLAEPATPSTLTHFPCGYSFFAAALIAVGASVGMVVKVSGAAGTILGWWGWAKFTYRFFGKGLQCGRVWKLVGFAIAIFTPLRFTPSWAGTDILLWAAVPWVLGWVVKASDENVSDGRWLDGLAGAACGLCVLMRYASLFLAVYAAGMILWQSRLRIPILTRRWGFFGLGLLPALALQVYINYFLSKVPAQPGGLGVERGLGFAVHRVREGFTLLSTANYPWVFWLPGRGMDLFTQVDGSLPWQLGILLAVFVLLVRWVRTYDLGVSAAARDHRIVALGLFVVLPLLLWGCMTLSTYDYVADQRYYLSIVPFSVLVIYSLASGVGATKRSYFTRILQISGVIYLTGYIAISLVGIVLLFVPGELGSRQRARLIGPAAADTFRHWPSMKVTYEFSAARRFVTGLLKEQPDTLLWTSKAQLFMADPTVDRSRLWWLHCKKSSSAWYLNGPARILILVSDDGGPPQELKLSEPDGPNRRAHCFVRLPDVNLLRRFPEEEVKVLETRVPAGRHVSLATSQLLEPK